MSHWRVLLAGVLLTSLFVLVSAAPAAAQPSPYIPITCENLDADSIIPVAINELGEIVGWYYDGAGRAHGFYRGHRGCVTIDAPADWGATGTFLMGINDLGRIVGTYSTTPEPGPGAQGNVGLLWDRGALTSYTVADATQTVLLGINNRGQIVGYYDDSTTPGGGPDIGFVLEDGKLTIVDNTFSSGSSLGVSGINPQGELVGTYLVDTLDREYGFYRDKDGQLFKIAFMDDTYAIPGYMMGINPQGDMTGIAFELFDDFATARAFVRDREGNILELKPGGGAPGVLVGKINASGDMVGAYLGSDGAFHGFVVNKRDLK